jgi:hypothetical protein
MKKHLKAVHMGLIDFKCDQSSYQTSRKELLTRHCKAVHMGLKDFIRSKFEPLFVWVMH